jgi:acyl-CoA thioester hydrolase
MSYVHRERVRFGDLDAMRHLNNVVFLRYFETARIAYLRELVPAHDPAHPENDEFGLIFAECHINYRSPVHFDEDVEVHCSIGTVRRSSFRVEFDMRVEGRLVAEGYGVLVGFDYNAQQAAPLPDSVRGRLEQETGAGGTGA